MAESTGYESGDPRYGEVPFGTVTEYDPSMDDDSPPLRPGDMVSIIEVRFDMSRPFGGYRVGDRKPISVRFDMSRPFGGYRVGDRITLADGMQGTVTGTIGQSSRDPDNRRLRERAPQEMAFARNFFLAVKDAWREELRERARSFAHSTPSPLPDGDARYKGCQGRALRAGTLCESRKVRCVAHRHGLLSIAPRKPGRVTSCRAV